MNTYVFHFTIKKAIHIVLYTMAFNSIIAVLLTTLGFGRGLAVNFVISQCIGLSNCTIIMIALVLLRPQNQISQAVIVVCSLFIGSALGILSGASITRYTELLKLEPVVVLKVMFVSVLFGVIISYFFSSQDSIHQSREIIDDERIKRLSGEKQIVEAELKMLQAQIEPHFLYNTLFNIQSLLDIDINKGKTMLGNLYRFLRSSSFRARKENSTIKQEVKFIRAYLDIFKTRMNERLEYRIDLPESIQHASFPPMLLQPLVENAIKHGLEPLVQGGKIIIQGERKGDILRIEVIDNGAGFNGMDQQGVGLQNIQDRLDVLYGEKGQFVLEDNVPNGLKARIEIPYV